MELPPDDLELIHALQIAPRASWTHIAEVLDRHPATVATRWDRLRVAGLAWVTAHQISAGRDGCAAFIGVQCLPGQHDDVLSRMCATPVMATVEDSARDWDLRLTALTSSWQEISNTVLPTVRHDPGVAKVRVTVVTRLYATGNHWRLDVLSPAQPWRFTPSALGVATTPAPRPLV